MMTLTDADRDRLAALLATNTSGDRGTQPSPDPAPITDPDSALVRQGSHQSDKPYHAVADGKPACGVADRTPSDVEYARPDIDTARAWRRPCQECFPDGDSTDTVSDGGRR